MHHQNVIATLDLLQDTEGVYRQIMEYCSGGDLYIVLLAPEQLGEAEADCFYQQLLQGVEYIHEMGVAHRDLKPETFSSPNAERSRSRTWTMQNAFARPGEGMHI